MTHTARPLAEQYVLPRDPAESYSPASRDMLMRFKSYEVEGGSIGTWLARVWKREVAAALIPPSAETPWDSTPILGISWRLGYRFYQPLPQGGWGLWQPDLPKAIVWRDHDLLMVHDDDAAQLELNPTP